MLRPNPPRLMFGDLLPSVAGLDSATIRVWAFVAATVVLLLGIVFEGI